MHRLLVDTPLLSEESPILPKEAANHLKVLRPKSGEEIELFDGHGRWRVYTWSPAGLFSDQAIKQSEQSEQSNNSLTLFACVTKGSRWDWTIEKATELGVTRIVPVISERTIVRIPREERAAKRARWQRIAEDAARQSDAKWLPEIREAVDFPDVLPLVSETTCFIGALTNPPSEPLLTAALKRARAEGDRGRGGRRFATFVGPEGDLTPDELGALMKIAIPTSFGPTILRAETAAIFAVGLLSAIDKVGPTRSMRFFFLRDT